MWFEKLTGFEEKSPEYVRENITVEGNTLTSHCNGKSMVCGTLETPSLAELRKRVQEGSQPRSRIAVSEIIANTQDLHKDPSNTNSLFQVASQFNLLEMVAPRVTPEYGVGIYGDDSTQGPACAIAAGAGTIYRNYFARVNNQTGQSADNQIDCLADMGKALGNTHQQLWEMKNGYALATEEGLITISERIKTSSEKEVDALRQLLRIGLQWNTQVTLADCNHTVSQAYCSALPVAYSSHSMVQWSKFAQLVLEASYEAIICAAILNYRNTGNNKVFLTLIGGGAFGNRIDWIIKAIKRSLELYKDSNLDIQIVSYSSSKEEVQGLVQSMQ